MKKFIANSLTRRSAAAVALLSVAAVSFSQVGWAGKVDTAATNYLKEVPAVGISVAVIQKGKVLLAKGYGFADRENKKPVQATTLFRLGSISKPVTAVMAMKLVEEKKLNLDQSISKWVPEYPASFPPITLRQILSHTSGIRHYKANDPFSRVTKFYSSSDTLKELFKDPLLFAPGDKYSYSTHAYTIAARAIETAAGTDFASAVRNSILKPADGELDCELLTDSKPNRTQLYTLVGNGAVLEKVREDNSWKFAGGGFESTARGLGKWASAVHERKILSPDSLTAMWRPMPLNNGSFTTYGLGWDVGTPDRVGHNGAQQGCRTAMIIDRTTGIVVTVMCNSGGAPRIDDLAKTVLEAVTQALKGK